MKKKLIKIVLLLFFLLETNSSLAVNKPPFKNISVSNTPKVYEEIFYEDFEGNIINLKNISSKIYLLNFWATWCLPCKEEMPSLDKLQTINGIKVFPINIELKNKKKTENFFRDLGIKNLSIYFDHEKKLVNLFSLRGLPTTIILNSEKNEIARIIGSIDFNDEKFIKWLNSISN